MSIDISSAFVADINGLHQQHINMWSIYNSSIRTLLAVVSLPILVGGVLLQTDTAPELDLNNLPFILVGSLWITPVLTVITVAVIVHYRLDVLLYARGLNKFRSIYTAQLNGADEQPLDVSPMPIDHTVPKLYEPFGPMGLIIHGSGFLNAFYLGLGLSQYGLESWYYIGGGIIYFVILEVGYYYMVTVSPIVGMLKDR